MSRVEYDKYLKGLKKVKHVPKGDGEAKPVQYIKNKFPNDNQKGKMFNYRIENGKIKIDNYISKVDFIIDTDGNLKVGRGHSYLSNGKDVQAAGTMKVNSQGYIRSIDNSSGYYQPNVAETKKFPKIFKNQGFNVDNTWIRIHEIKSNASNYVITHNIYYQGPIKCIK